MAADASYTPALGFNWLTPLYDLAVALLTRESLWRSELVSQIAPKPGDRILDIGCGTGTLAIQLKSMEPEAEIAALDPGPKVIGIARQKSMKAGCRIVWRLGFLNEQPPGAIGQFTKVVSSLVLHQSPTKEKLKILRLARSSLNAEGTLHIADYGCHRSWLMRTLFRNTVQRIDGIGDTQPNADGILPELMLSAGFTDVEETGLIRTPTGSISIHSARTDE
jgi:ubiquinone/menaquinone biosynthesis C-methylase UbiE